MRKLQDDFKNRNKKEEKIEEKEIIKEEVKEEADFEAEIFDMNEILEAQNQEELNEMIENQEVEILKFSNDETQKQNSSISMI